jgi:predicted small integral membrane protein
MNFDWMGWTPATGLFFGAIILALLGMALWQVMVPRNEPRVGMLGLATQRGDRLFLTLLGAAFIHIAWIRFAPAEAPLWGASLSSLVYAGLIFRFA